MQKELVDSIELNVRFNEADPLGIVWHGHYIRYFEDGREAFGNKYGIAYLDFYHYGYVVPVVNVQCDNKRSLRYGDKVKIEPAYMPTDAAKIIFHYRLFNVKTNELVATGSSVQVFLDKQTSMLQLINPPFFEKWKKDHALME